MSKTHGVSKQKHDGGSSCSDSEHTPNNNHKNRNGNSHQNNPPSDSDSSNKTYKKSLATYDDNDTDAVDDNQRKSENKSSSTSNDNEKQPKLESHSGSFSDMNESNNGGQAAQNKNCEQFHASSQKDSDDVSEDDTKQGTTSAQNKHSQKGAISHSDSDDNAINNENSKVSHKQTTDATDRDDDHVPSAPISNKQKSDDIRPRHPSCQFRTDKKWLNLQFHDDGTIKKPDELENKMKDPPGEIDEEILDRVQGSMIGMALGDALGAHVEFRPHQYLVQNPVTDLKAGGTWGLNKGQFTDDTSMALCLANSLVARRNFVPYDQLVRYKWWYQNGYMSSTGHCFDIGAATRRSIEKFEHRQKKFAERFEIPLEDMDCLSERRLLKEFNVYCSDEEAAGNGALMRLAPVPLFFYRSLEDAIEYSGCSGQITHGDIKARDACRYYGALIAAAVDGCPKKQLLNRKFYSKYRDLFGEEGLHPDIIAIAEGSYQKDGYEAGIRGKGYVVRALEAALWAFWSDENSFETGALAAVNLGDDTDTTAAIYGQLAGAHYGYKNLPSDWLKYVYAHKYMKKLSKWIIYEGEQWHKPSTKN